MSMKKITCFGEALLRFSPPDHLRFGQAHLYELHYGGAELNTAISLALFGMPVSFVTRLPVSDLSDGVVRQLHKFSVDTRHIVFGGKRLGLYYLESGAVLRGSKVIYDREHSAMAEIGPGMIDWEKLFEEAGWFHFTGITPALSQAAADETLRAVTIAAGKNIPVSIDLNFRSKLWQFGKHPSEIMPALLEKCNYVLGDLNTVNTYFGIRGTGENDAAIYEDAMQQLMKRFSNLRKVVFSYRGLTNASNNTFGAYLCNGTELFRSREYEMNNMVDRLGGGDALMSGIIYGLNNMEKDEDALNFGVAASVLKSSIPGDTNFVTVAEVTDIMKGNISARISR